MVSIRKAWCNAVVIMIALWSSVAVAAEPSKPVEAPVPRAPISEADRLGLPPTPDYVTAWPRKVEVAKPDPVLGDKPFQEIWAYNKEFAKRFKNLPPEGVTEDFSPGAYALVFRVYKTVLWNTNYPPQYVCEYDLYFDNSIRIPLSDTIKKVIQYPPGVTESYLRLEPMNESDRQALANAKAASFLVQQQPAIFADGPLDGRFATFGITTYYPDLAPSVAMVRLTAIFSCRALAPKAESTHFWLSLFGKHPYLEGPRGKALSGGHVRGLQGSFNSGPAPVKEGYLRMPEAFYRAVLPKVTLVKALNECINQRHVFSLPNKWPPESWAKVFAACEDMEKNGTIYSVLGGRVSEGLSDIGF